MDLNKLSSYIKIYENAFPDDFIDNILKTFYNDKEYWRPGATAAGIKRDRKNSHDLNLKAVNPYSGYEGIYQNKELNIKIEELYYTYWLKYLKQFNSWLDNPIRCYKDAFGKEKDNYCFPVNQVQLYEKNKGHFNSWHADEILSTNTHYLSEFMLCRLFVFMVYLNDVEEGGETEFLYGETKVIPKKGSLVIWPAHWPFTHRGNVPISSDKLILTSWLNYDNSSTVSRGFNNHSFKEKDNVFR